MLGLQQLLLIVAVVALVGCETVPVRPDGAPGAEQSSGKVKTAPVPLSLADKRHSRFAKVENWTISGRLGIRQKDDGFSAGMEWEQKGPDFDIGLLDPLGRRVARLQGNDKHVVLNTADGKRFEADNAEKILDKELGWSFPVQSLLHWVKGTPDPNYLVWRQEYDDLGRLVLLHQGKWKLRITKYQNLETEYIPRLIRMERKDIKVKLLIRDWE